MRHHRRCGKSTGFGAINRLPVTIEWLSDNGNCYIAGEMRSFARDIGLEPRTTPIESPQSNGMAAASTVAKARLRLSRCEPLIRRSPTNSGNCEERAAELDARFNDREGQLN
jgi:transposase InsO family protein